VTEYQKREREKAYKRNRAKARKHASDHKLGLHNGKYVMWKDAVKERKLDERREKRRKEKR
jgi:hypothetical protein